MIGVLLIGGFALYIYYKGKTKGFGPYNTSTLLLIVALSITGLLRAGGMLEGSTVANILIAVVGFAGGLFANGKIKDDDG